MITLTWLQFAFLMFLLASSFFFGVFCTVNSECVKIVRKGRK